MKRLSIDRLAFARFGDLHQRRHSPACDCATPNFLSRSSRLKSFMACNTLSRAQSRLSRRVRMARSLSTRAWLLTKT